MIDIPYNNIADYDYPLPDARIALFPAPQRDGSKLLLHCHGRISDHSFGELPQLLPPDGLLVMNNTRVIHARLPFRKSTGAAIEIFCLEPLAPSTDVQLAMQQTAGCKWRCLVGNAKKWKSGELVLPIQVGNIPCTLTASIVAEEVNTFRVRFSWEPAELSFAQIIEAAGKVPLPPYIRRAATPTDAERYQTIFAAHDGSVAAPTAGLHFTDEVFHALSENHIRPAYITLHVGAGTFKPVATDDVRQHVMHPEQVVVSKQLLDTLAAASGNIIAVGTTAVRSLESLYWLGASYLQTGAMPEMVDQWQPYQTDAIPYKTQDILIALREYLTAHNADHLSFSTQVMLLPGYKFRLVTDMLTNFHQPKSTLLLLISAFLGPAWRDIYDHALANDYRFLSYGDACLFL